MKYWKIGVITGAISGSVGALLIDCDLSILTISFIGAVIGIAVGYIATRKKR